MHILYDEDAHETVVYSRPCTSCGGSLGKCRGVGCNGSFGIGSRPRTQDEIRAIKSARQRREEEDILRMAEAVVRKRGAPVTAEQIARLADDLSKFTD